MLPRFSRYGGVEGYAWRLAEALAKRGHKVDFICARQETEAPEGVNVRAVGRPPLFKACKMLWFLVRAEMLRRGEKYDLVFSLGKTWNQDIIRSGSGPLRVFWRLSREAWPAGSPRLIKDIARRLQIANWLTLILERRIFTRTPHVVAVSDVVRQWLEEAYPHLAQQGSGQTVHTIFNCPDMSLFTPPAADERSEARRIFGVADGRYALGVATTNFRLKGIAPLIKSLALLPENVTLHVAGGRKPEHYRQLAASLGVGERVFFHGKVSNMRQFYHALDMFVLPTFYDTLANVVLEAMSSGLKTLCSNRAGAAAFLPPERIILNPGDEKELAEKILRLKATERAVPFVPRGSGLDELVALAESVLREKRGERNSA
jgi:UDP-glucose:(heptosyl)LPS alpha-1,3-glucosyltransferase